MKLFISDIVVGAPYEDDMKGTVYLYHGGATRLTLAQMIQSRDFGSDLKSFGWYISATYDIDNNNYPGIYLRLFWFVKDNFEQILLHLSFYPLYIIY